LRQRGERYLHLTGETPSRAPCEMARRICGREGNRAPGHTTRV
jgi:hypothetical protein